jgi:hypothetical protein
MGAWGENISLLKTEQNILTLFHSITAVSFIEDFILRPMEPCGGFLSP